MWALPLDKEKEFVSYWLFIEEKNCPKCCDNNAFNFYLVLGELVEVIDTKIKEKRANNQAEAAAVPTSDLNPPSKEPNKNLSESKESLKKQEALKEIDEKKKFNVIDKLVLKFDKDLLKSENFAHLLKGKSEVTVIINDANTKINDDDYDIFVLNDSNEIITELNNIEMSLDENGIINKRASLEAFSVDKLPENINVFFKINE